jgi:putative MFS transporter
MKKEYGISTARAAVFPIAALTGTTIGSFLWGMLSDRLGRRAAILLASLMFMATATCSLMPAFQINVGMCFVMGLSAGGMLPIVYALMAESVPAKKRGWLVVLHGGMGTVGGFLAASAAASLLVPHFSWRILWFLNLPTGAILLILNRWIPESPRFLLERGLVQEAGQVTARYGVILERTAPGESSTEPDPILNGKGHGSIAGLGKLFHQPFLGQTVTVGLYGLGWGLVNWGFLTFLPTILDDLGLKGQSASELLFLGALLSIPGTVLVSWMYGMWSTKKSMVLFALATTLTLVGFGTLNPAAPGRGWVLTLLVAALLVTSGGVIAMLSPYTAEVYPTNLRGTGSGLAAGSSKLGGILGPPMAATVLAFFPGIGATALVAAAPITAAAVVVAFKGVETRGRRLEEITTHSIALEPEKEPVR